MVSKKGEWLIANRSPSYFDRYKCSVVGRGGSRTALTGAVTMEQAGSAVGAGSARPSSPVVILLSQRVGKPHPYKNCHLVSPFSIFDREAQLSPVNRKSHISEVSSGDYLTTIGYFLPVCRREAHNRSHLSDL